MNGDVVSGGGEASVSLERTSTRAPPEDWRDSGPTFDLSKFETKS